MTNIEKLINDNTRKEGEIVRVLYDALYYLACRHDGIATKALAKAEELAGEV